MTPFEAISLALTISAAAAAVLFVVAYMRSPWWRNPMGKNAMALMAVIAVMVTLSVIFRVTDSRAPAWFSATLWSIVNVPLWWRVVLLWRAQHGAYAPPPHKCTTCGESCDGS